MLDTARSQRLDSLRAELLTLRSAAQDAERAASAPLSRVHPVHAAGAANLVRYVALRSRDLRDVQDRLTAEGLSSLGRMEADVLRNLDAVLGTIDAALGHAAPHEHATADADTRFAPATPLSVHAAALLGGTADDRQTRIMVTLPSEAADDPALVTRFARAGMDVARINCAHDDSAAWERMARHVRDAGASIRIATDLAGPKLRTGPLEPGPRVVKVSPTRDALGRVTEPASVWLVAPRADGSAAPAGEIPITDDMWLARLRIDDTVEFTDTRGRSRYMTVVALRGGGAQIEGDRTAYLGTGTLLDVDGRETRVGPLPPVDQALRVRRGEIIELRPDEEPGFTHEGRHRVGCTVPEALEVIRVGDRVLFDDGKIEGFVRAVGVADGQRVAEVEVTLASPRGTKLRAEKGINLPDTDLPISALADEDLRALDAVAGFTDIVQLSFARSPGDVARLFTELDARGAGHLGVVVKVETVRAFRALPEILLELMQRPRVGIMIARGDLGVEAGWERLAEVQEEILWLCEAAHVPVIWATQVLDSLAGSGVPTRAEVTDAAAGERAECVMLNKGPHIEEAIEALDDILRRMHGHLEKKRPLLRRLRAWSHEG
ncbi:MAG: pyruvate kinase [Microbacterium sp. 67-17]|uniref:pyruvate kinase n=1 Tax=Microbacterium sp. 67-17 TaxID=1895782 RepID=UPI0009606DE8|nr:pyruvate kinase [Microbacterium sp. 67-17]OJW01439.1 MAG: pyruvate kinase [Microbacterium sp. 67-17]